MAQKVKISCHQRKGIFASLFSTLQNEIYVYTDGSCNPNYAIGDWASLVLIDREKIVLSGYEEATTHQRMELTAAINTLDYIIHNGYSPAFIKVYADSQYVVDIARRKEKLLKNNFITSRQSAIRNVDLVKKLISFDTQLIIEFIKIKAHQRKEERENDFNLQVDLISRKIVRERTTLAKLKIK